MARVAAPPNQWTDLSVRWAATNYGSSTADATLNNAIEQIEAIFQMTAKPPPRVDAWTSLPRLYGASQSVSRGRWSHLLLLNVLWTNPMFVAGHTSRLVELIQKEEQHEAELRQMVAARDDILNATHAVRWFEREGEYETLVREMKRAHKAEVSRVTTVCDALLRDMNATHANQTAEATRKVERITRKVKRLTATLVFAVAVILIARENGKKLIEPAEGSLEVTTSPRVPASLSDYIKALCAACALLDEREGNEQHLAWIMLGVCMGMCDPGAAEEVEKMEKLVLVEAVDSLKERRARDGEGATEAGDAHLQTTADTNVGHLQTIAKELEAWAHFKAPRDCGGHTPWEREDCAEFSERMKVHLWLLFATVTENKGGLMPLLFQMSISLDILCSPPPDEDEEYELPLDLDLLPWQWEEGSSKDTEGKDRFCSPFHDGAS